MACLLVSAAAGICVGAARHVVKHFESKKPEIEPIKFGSDTKWSDKLKYLEFTLFGGAFLLLGEHVIHGEITPFPPFLTAMNDTVETKVMLTEMSTVGVCMLVGCIVAWAIGVFIYDLIKFRKRKPRVALNEGK